MTDEEYLAHFGCLPSPPRPEPPSPRAYMMSAPGSGLVKIGASRNVSQRLRALRAQTGKQLVCLWDHRGGFELERALHRVFDSQRVKGEWFALPDGDAVELVTEAIARGLTPPGGPAYEIGEIVRPNGWPILTCRGTVVGYQEPYRQELELRYVVDMVSCYGKQLRDRGQHVMREHEVRRAA